MKKVVIHIFHDDKSSLGTGSHVYVFAQPREPWMIRRTRNIARLW